MYYKPTFFPDQNKALLPWSYYAFKPKHMAVASGLTALFIIFTCIAEGLKFDKIMQYGLFTYIASFCLFYFFRYWNTNGPFTTPLIVDEKGILAPTFFYKTKIKWTEVQKIESVHTFLGNNISPIERNFIVHKKSGRSKRIFVPDMSADDEKIFFQILINLSVKNNFEIEA